MELLPISRRTLGGLAALMAVRPAAARVQAVPPPLFATVRAWADAWGEPNAYSLYDLYAPHGVYEDAPYGIRVADEELLRALQMRLARVDRPLREPTFVVGIGSWAVAGYDFIGVNQGFFPNAPRGVPFAIPTVTRFLIRDGRIRHSIDAYPRPGTNGAAGAG